MTSREKSRYRAYRPVSLTVIPLEGEREKEKGEREREREGEGEEREGGGYTHEGSWHIRRWCLSLAPNTISYYAPGKGLLADSMIGGRRCSICDVKSINSPVREYCKKGHYAIYGD